MKSRAEVRRLMQAYIRGLTDKAAHYYAVTYMDHLGGYKEPKLPRGLSDEDAQSIREELLRIKKMESD